MGSGTTSDRREPWHDRRHDASATCDVSVRGRTDDGAADRSVAPVGDLALRAGRPDEPHAARSWPPDRDHGRSRRRSRAGSGPPRARPGSPGPSRPPRPRRARHSRRHRRHRRPCRRTGPVAAPRRAETPIGPVRAPALRVGAIRVWATRTTMEAAMADGRAVEVAGRAWAGPPAPVVAARVPEPAPPSNPSRRRSDSQRLPEPCDQPCRQFYDHRSASSGRSGLR